jgi:hypothetical protein
MNWSRGLLWLWVLATALWLMLIAYVAYVDRHQIMAQYQSGQMDGLRWKVQVLVKAAIIPPATFFVLGWGVLWIARRFNRL